MDKNKIKRDDPLAEENIRENLEARHQNIQIMIYDQVDSTNDQAKKLNIYRDEIVAIIANEQTAGRGRRGKSFQSPDKSGIYLSLALRPKIKTEEMYFSTILTVIAVHRVLTRLSQQQIDIKWVNDLFLEGKKISGILTEFVNGPDETAAGFIVAGIGININANLENYAEELKNIVGSLYLNHVSRNQIIAEIINELIPLFHHFDKKGIIEEYKLFQMLLGEEVTYWDQDIQKTAHAIDIDQDGGLVVLENGKKRSLNSGEVSVKLKK